MGTRNLTIVKNEKGEIKIAQYGQWDGYPEGQGVTILRFIRNKEDMEDLKMNLDKCKFFNRCDDIKDFLEAYDKASPMWSTDPDNRTPEMKNWFETLISRGIGGEILSCVAYLNFNRMPKEHNGYIYLRDESDFGKDSLFCEWAYVVDLQTNKFMVFKGFNRDKSKEHELFATVEEEVAKEFEGRDYRYYGCKFLKEYDLDNLPTEEDFINDFKDADEEDE